MLEVWGQKEAICAPGEDVVRRCSMARLSSQTSCFRKARPDANTRQCRITCPTAAAPPPAKACSFEIHCGSARTKEDMLENLEVFDKWQLALGT
jgi:hypothetical protein